MGERQLMRVSCKAALYNTDRSKVLLAQYEPNRFGLPGGHVEVGETPDQAIQRELQEELGLEGVKVRHGDFMVHENGKLVLAYVGTIDEETPLKVQFDEMEGAAWHLVQDVALGKVAIASYKDFIVKNAVA